MRRRPLQAALIAAAFAAVPAHAATAERPIPRAALKQGSEFTSADLRAMQADEFTNPGMLWVTRGERLWKAPEGPAGKSCAGCHGEARDSMKGVAARYPLVDSKGAGLVNLPGRVNFCRVRHQGAAPLAQESDALLGLTAFVTYQSRGMPMSVAIDGAAAEPFEQGRARFYRRLGQMNLSCAQCHDANWGRTLLHETISQGHGTGWPGYRLEWQSFGSLQRRLRACYSGLRAEMPDYGAQALLELELFLAWRAEGLPIEAPGVRR